VIVSEARQVLQDMGVVVADTVLAQRVAFSHAVISGATVTEYEPDGKASAELHALWAEISRRLQ
jgi:chromosome partitioning protein